MKIATVYLDRRLLNKKYLCLPTMLDEKTANEQIEMRSRETLCTVLQSQAEWIDRFAALVIANKREASTSSSSWLTNPMNLPACKFSFVHERNSLPAMSFACILCQQCTSRLFASNVSFYYLSMQSIDYITMREWCDNTDKTVQDRSMHRSPVPSILNYKTPLGRIFNFYSASSFAETSTGKTDAEQPQVKDGRTS